MKSILLNLIYFCILTSLTGKVIHSQDFTKIEIGPHVTDSTTSMGCTWGDFDNDGDEDLFVSNGQTSGLKNFLFLNQGSDNDYAFTPANEVNILKDAAVSREASWGDYDNDGDLDLFVANQMGNNYNYLYQNNGDGTLTRITEGHAVLNTKESEAAGWFDYDRDGYLDIFVGCPTIANDVYHNKGDGTFTRITDDTLAKDIDTWYYSWCDFDNDRDYDILIAYTNNSAALFLNNGKGGFTKISEGMIIDNPNQILYGGYWVDYDNDGDWDLVSAGRSIFRNEGPGSSYKFTKITTETIVAEIGFSPFSIWADIDNDGDIDCFVGFYENKNKLFSNNGDGSFTQITGGVIVEENPTMSLGCAWADYDQDGDMDIYICNAKDENNLLYRNENSNGNSWIEIKLKGTASNASAIGAVIKVKANTDSVQVWQMRAIEGQSTFMGQNSMIAHFGLGTASIIDSLIILWPAGHNTVLTDVSVNQLLTITENMPENYLRAEFEADTTIGINELSVQFTDRSLFDPGNPITSWSWDFDGDGVEDSNTQNPVNTFSNAEGEVFDISLVISNGKETDSIQRDGLIKVLPPDGNLALLGKATASSERDILFNSQKTIDGNINSYWTSKGNDNDWLKIELNTVHNIGKVVIQWNKSYYGDGYSIQTSMDDIIWNKIYCEDSGNGTQDTLLFTGKEAKFVKWEGFSKPLSIYSILEFEIYLSDGNEYPPTCPPVNFKNNLTNEPGISIYPNPAENKIIIDFYQEIDPNTAVELIDVTGKLYYKKVCTDSHSKLTINISKLAKGMYYIRISSDKYTSVQKFVKN